MTRLSSLAYPFVLALVAVTGLGLFTGCGESDVAGGEDVKLDSTPVPDAIGADVVGLPDVADVEVSILDAADTAPDSTDADAADCEGCFGSPCEVNSDCFSGWCVDGPLGGTCTQLCDAACPTDWTCKAVGGGGDPQFICIWVHQPYCRPCRVDGDCGHPLASGFANRCVAQADGSGSFCATQCQAGDSCPAGASCTETATAGEPRCLPDSGVCDCAAQHIEAGASTDCFVENAFGSCKGTRACSATGLSACNAATPAEELCNGQDDDCDGKTDEDFNPGGSKVFVSETGGELALGANCSEGACGTGQIICAADGAAAVCNGTGAGATEICNGKDDDCDGATDENFKADGSVTFKDLDGTTGLVLGDPCGVGVCAGGEVVCAPSTVALACSTHTAAGPELCNLDDDDCDGVPDDGLVVKNDLSKLAEAGCATEGVCGLKDVTTASCIEGAWSCIYESPFYEPEETSCDNRDNDCDGSLDELPSTLDSDTLAAIGCLNQGVCAVPGSTTATCSNGAWSCKYGHPAYQIVETRCDGFDNDCDGKPDPDGIEEAQKVFEDKDMDTFGNPDVTAKQCSPGDGWVKNDDDCYGDANISVNPDHETWETKPHVAGNFDWNCDKKAEKRFTSVVGKCQGKLSTDLSTFSLCVPTTGNAAGWRLNAAECGVEGDWYEEGDCEISFLTSATGFGSDEDSIGCVAGLFCIAACTWEKPSKKTQECR
ncbi:MAG: MopE-related protein [Myxococcota bacterium]